MRILIALLLMTVPAAAEWQVTHTTDRMTDRKMAFAGVTAPGSSAQLYVGCKNGQVFPEITYPRRVAWRSIGASYRFDDGPVVQRIAPMSQDGTEVWAWIGDPEATVAKMKRSKRLRVQVDRDFLDFNIAGADKALSQIRCH
jgi:hypothetical protein